MGCVITNIDAGAAAGVLEICSAGYAVVLAAIQLAKPSFTLNNGVITMANPPRSDPSADATGVAAIARIKDSDGTVVIDGLVVGVATGEIQLNSVSLNAGQTVSLTSGVISHA